MSRTSKVYMDSNGDRQVAASGGTISIEAGGRLNNLEGVVNVTDSTLSVTVASHNGKTITLNRAAGQAVTLPASTGGGARFRFVVGTTITSNTTTIKAANASDSIQGFSTVVSDDSAAAKGFAATAGTDDTITLDGTTRGGYVGDVITVEDIAENRFQVEVVGRASGTEATPFSATVP